MHIDLSAGHVACTVCVLIPFLRHPVGSPYLTWRCILILGNAAYELYPFRLPYPGCVSTARAGAIPGIHGRAYMSPSFGDIISFNLG